MDPTDTNRFPEFKDPVPSDLEIAQEASLRPVAAIADELGLQPAEVALLEHAAGAGRFEGVGGDRVLASEHDVVERREGDPPRLISGGTRAETELDWRPRRAELADIIADAWRFMLAHREASA